MAYSVYTNGGAGGPIDYATPVAVLEVTADTTPSGLTPGSWSFAVRAYEGFGDGGFGDVPWGGLGSSFGEAGFAAAGFGSGEEQNLDCAVTIVVGEYGSDITNLPLPPVGLRAFAQAGGSIRVEWPYPASPAPAPAPSWPTGFDVFVSAGSTLSYASSAASVPFNSGIAGYFVANISGFSDGVSYVLGVRAFNACGVEQNTTTVSVTAASVGPAAVDSLVGVAIV